MSRRILAALALVVCAAIAACSVPVTAPQQPLVAPSTPRLEILDPSTCRSGWISSDGRCG